jgi:hypothetical protein
MREIQFFLPKIAKCAFDNSRLGANCALKFLPIPHAKGAKCAEFKKRQHNRRKMRVKFSAKTYGNSAQNAPNSLYNIRLGAKCAKFTLTQPIKRNLREIFQLKISRHF